MIPAYSTMHLSKNPTRRRAACLWSRLPASESRRREAYHTRKPCQGPLPQVPVFSARQSNPNAGPKPGRKPLTDTRIGEIWSRPGSNRRPPGCKPGALPIELRPRLNQRPARSRLAASLRPSASTTPHHRDRERCQKQTKQQQNRPIRHPVPDFHPRQQPGDIGPDKIRTCDLVLIRDAL